jgi:hypothetical protein
MSSFFDEQGRTRVSAEAYIEYVAGGKPAENAAHRKKGHFRMETDYMRSSWASNTGPSKQA